MFIFTGQKKNKNILRTTAYLIGLALIGLSLSCSPQTWDQRAIEGNFQKARQQYRLMSAALPAFDNYPRTLNDDGSLWLCGSDWWTSGFYPGSLWYLYAYFGDVSLMHEAHARTMPLAKEAENRSTHDLGFMLYNSFGNGYRLTKNPEYRTILLKGAASLASRYHPRVGCIQSWDASNRWDFPVIIDNMMNLEYLFWATRETGDSSYYHMAVSHADRTLENHFRPDYSSFHVVTYDTLSGDVLSRQTHQGYADSSAWSRGQAWGLYGFTMAYRETKYERYLQQAQQIADYLLDHPRFPEDGILYWDLDAPDIPDAERDASAAAVMGAALVELSRYSDGAGRDRYLKAAEKIVASLSKPPYHAGIGENGNFLLKHSVGAKPFGGEVDVPLVYADYYYLEALARLKEVYDQ